MKKFTILQLIFWLAFSPMLGHGQAAAGDSSNVRDRQNQRQFLKPDMESKDYNFYQRKIISQPLMPRYDLDSAVFQNDKKKKKQQQAFLARQYAFPAKPK